MGAAETAGIVAGVLDVGTNLLRTAELGHRVLDPMDLVSFPRGTSALNQVLSADAAMARYGLGRMSHPSRIVDDAKDAVRQTLVGLIPGRQPLGHGPNPAFHQPLIGVVCGVRGIPVGSQHFRACQYRRAAKADA